MSDNVTTTNANTKKKSKSRREAPPQNTCAPSSLKKRLLRQLAGIEAHLVNNPEDNLSRMRVAKINELLRT